MINQKPLFDITDHIVHIKQLWGKTTYKVGVKMPHTYVLINRHGLLRVNDKLSQS